MGSGYPTASTVVPDPLLYINYQYKYYVHLFRVILRAGMIWMGTGETEGV